MHLQLDCMQHNEVGASKQQTQEQPLCTKKSEDIVQKEKSK